MAVEAWVQYLPWGSGCLSSQVVHICSSQSTPAREIPYAVVVAIKNDLKSSNMAITDNKYKVSIF